MIGFPYLQDEVHFILAFQNVKDAKNIMECMDRDHKNDRIFKVVEKNEKEGDKEKKEEEVNVQYSDSDSDSDSDTYFDKYIDAQQIQSYKNDFIKFDEDRCVCVNVSQSISHNKDRISYHELKNIRQNGLNGLMLYVCETSDALNMVVMNNIGIAFVKRIDDREDKDEDTDKKIHLICDFLYPCYQEEIIRSSLSVLYEK